MRFAFYDDEGGITMILEAPSKKFALCQAKDFVECDDSVTYDEHYVDVQEKAIREKRHIDAGYVSAGLALTLEGLPKGLNVVTNGVNTVTDNEPLIIEYDLPGTYTVRFSGHAQYLDHEMEVTVGDA